MRSGNYIQIGEHHCLLPELPKSKKDIFFWDKKKEDQFWVRDEVIKEYRQIWFDFLPFSSKSPIYTRMYQTATIYDSDGLLISLNEEDSDYIDKTYKQERDRRLNGVWFFNNGEPTWITGGHYYFLMWARMQRHDGQGLFADYRRFQADYFRILHHCRVTPHILGCFVSKPKKTGITNANWSGHYLNRATLFANKNLGYMNINSQQAAKTFNDYFMYSYNGLVSPLKPEVKLLSLVDGTVVFGHSYNGSKKVRKPNTENEDDINSSVMCVATKPKAFDVAVMDEICFDEPTKYKESFAEIWRTNKEAIKIQSKINGKATLFNYTEGEDTQSFREARDVFLDSKLKTVTVKSNGQTQSGLICWHIPAYASWEGAFDRHGECDEKRAHDEIEIERDKVKSNKRQLQTITRQYANTEREAWGSAGAGSTFDNVRLGDLLATLELDQKSSIENNYKEGKLAWTNKAWEIGLFNKRPKGQFCPVEFIPLTKDEMARGEHGKVRIYNEIPAVHQNAILKLGRDEWGNILRPERYLYTLGGDPTQEAAASEIIEGSKNCFYTMSRLDERMDSLLGRVSSKLLMIEYFARPEVFDEAYEDLVKQIIYTGSLSIVEANVPAMATRLMQEGLGHYVLIKNKEGVITFWERWMGLAHEAEKEYHLIRTTSNGNDKKERLEQFVNLIKQYLYKPEEGGKDYGAVMKSERLLRQLMDVDVENTKMYDMFMALGYCLLCDDIYTGLLMNSQSDPYSGISFGNMMNALSRA
jgi:hypothetical protein